MAEPQQDNTPAIPDKPDEDLFIRNLCMGLNTKQAAIKAGYSPSYADSTLYQRVKKPSFQAKVKDAFLAGNALQVPKVLNVHKNILNALNDKQGDDLIDAAGKAKHTTKQILQIAQILSPDTQPMHQTVNIKELQVLMGNTGQGNTNAIEHDTVDAEVVASE